jgi:hypothetical protein
VDGATGLLFDGDSDDEANDDRHTVALTPNGRGRGSMAAADSTSSIASSNLSTPGSSTSTLATASSDGVEGTVRYDGDGTVIGSSNAAESQKTNRYGFFLSSTQSESCQLSEKETERRRKKEDEREKKWIKMCKNMSKYERRKPAKLKRRIRKGIPDRLRGKVWNMIGGVNDFMERRPGDYQQLCEECRQRAMEEPENLVYEVIGA